MQANKYTKSLKEVILKKSNVFKTAGLVRFVTKTFIV